MFELAYLESLEIFIHDSLSAAEIFQTQTPKQIFAYTALSQNF